MATKTPNSGLSALEKWDIATTTKFLKLYRNYKCLWDHTDSSYKDKAERQTALENISSAMNLPGFDSRYVVLKVRALRSTYIYERRKVRQRLKSGEKFQTHLGWFHLADSFLRNYVVEKTYLHGDANNDPNKDLPPPVTVFNVNEEIDVEKDDSQWELYTEQPHPKLENQSDISFSIEEDDNDDDITQELIETKKPVLNKNVQKVSIAISSNDKKNESKKSERLTIKRRKSGNEVFVEETYPVMLSGSINPVQKQSKVIVPSAPLTPAATISVSTAEPSTSTMNFVDEEDEFEAFAKSVAMQLRKIPREDAYGLQVQFQYLLSQAKLKAMGKKTSITLEMQNFFNMGK